jgi:hypothetical protein
VELETYQALPDDRCQSPHWGMVLRGRIENDDPTTARLLRRGVTTGSRCRYLPDPDTPADWML